MKNFLNSRPWQQFLLQLQSHLKKNYISKSFSAKPWNAEDTRYFSKGVLRLNPLFTTERPHRSSNYFSDPVLRSGYLAYYLPINMIKTVMILERSFGSLKNWPDNIHVADIGSGPLTMSLAFVLWLSTRDNSGKKFHITIDAFEQNPTILKDGGAILKSLATTCPSLENFRFTFNPHNTNLVRHRFTRKKHDLIFCGNIFNEMSERHHQWHFASSMLTQLSGPDTRFIIMEPGTKKSARDLQALRDQLIEESGFTVLAPCLHQNTCPLNLEAKGDWCHFTQDWQAPAFIHDMDILTRMDKKWLVYSYLVLQKNPVTPPQYLPEDFLAITNLFKKDNRTEIVGCGPSGRVRFILLPRECGDDNRKLFDLKRGRYFKINPAKIVTPPRGEKFCNLGKGSKVSSS